MDSLKDTVQSLYGQKVRVRVCGLLLTESGLLLARHHGVGTHGHLWVPPGGGVEFGESMQQALEREYLEETGLHVTTQQLVLVNEYIEPPLHAIELFFEVKLLNGELKTGTDPEITNGRQVLEEVRYMQLPELKQQKPETLHTMLRNISSFHELLRPGIVFTPADGGSKAIRNK